MTGDAFTFVSGFFSQVWRFFISWFIPGTNLTPAGLSFGVLAIIIIIRFVKRFGGSLNDVSGDEK